MVDIKNNIISLIGMIGCGKTSVGKILAKKLGARFVDIDDEIVLRFGEIKAIFADGGEGKFREIEYAVLSDVIGASGGELLILSCGGGLVTYKKNRELLCENTTVVWLKRSVESVAADERVLMRPPVNGDAENYRRILTARYPIYSDSADYSFYNAFPQRTARAIIKKMFE